MMLNTSVWPTPPMRSPGFARSCWQYYLTIPSHKCQHCDNQGAIATTGQPSYADSGRSKHIDIRFHIIRDAFANGLIRLEYVRTSDMTADILTKPLPKELHLRHVKGLGMDKAPKNV